MPKSEIHPRILERIATVSGNRSGKTTAEIVFRAYADLSKAILDLQSAQERQPAHNNDDLLLTCEKVRDQLAPMFYLETLNPDRVTNMASQLQESFDKWTAINIVTGSP